MVAIVAARSTEPSGPSRFSAAAVRASGDAPFGPANVITDVGLYGKHELNMPRRREVPKRPIQPDPKYADRMVGRFTNVIMRDGKKSLAERIVYGAFNVIESKTRNDPLAMFRRALDNIRPRV